MTTARVEDWVKDCVPDPQEQAECFERTPPTMQFCAAEVKEVLDNDECSDVDESSFNDDEIPSSEEDLMSTIVVLADADDYIPPITRTKRSMLAYLAANQPDINDDQETTLLKKKRRMTAIFDFRNFLKKKRRIKEFKRLRKVKEMKLGSPSKEAFALEKQELADKKLNKPFYHEETEPDCYKTLLAKRREAIKRKYELYALDPSYREEMEQRLVNFMSMVTRQIEEAENLANKTMEIEDELDDQIGDADGVNVEDDEEQESEIEESSFYDLNIPQSERDFFSSDLEEDPLQDTEPESNRLDLFFYFLNKCRPEPGDDYADKLLKFLKEVEVKAQYKNFLFNRRALKALARFKTLENMSLESDPEAEARVLLDMEMKDKKLDKSYYYTPDERDYYKKVLEKRRRAIKKKYEAYVKYPEIRTKMKVDAYVEAMRIQPAPLFEFDKQNEHTTLQEEDASSFNDSEIPTSEEEFASDTKIPYPDYFIKPNTRTRQALYDELDKYEVDNLNDSVDLINMKRKARLRVIQRYKMRLRDRRRKKAVERLHTVNSLGIRDPVARAQRLRQLELVDKKLHRKFLYLPGEPEEFKRILAKRIHAIDRKYKAYVENQAFRDEMEQRILSGMQKRKIIDEYDDETEEDEGEEEEGEDVCDATYDDPDYDPFEAHTLIEGSLPLQDGRQERKRDFATKGVWPMRRESAPPVIQRGMYDPNISLHYGSFECGLPYNKGLLRPTQPDECE